MDAQLKLDEIREVVLAFNDGRMTAKEAMGQITVVCFTKDEDESPEHILHFKGH